MIGLNWKRFILLLVATTLAIALIAGIAYAVADNGNVEDGSKGFRGRCGAMSEYRDEIKSEIAGKLGLSVEDLQKEKESGKTIAQIAEEKGVSTEDLANSVAAKTGEIADRLVAEGEITEEQAENIKANAEERALKRMESGPGRMGMRGGNHGVMKEYRDEIQSEIAGKLGLSVEDLQKEIEGG